MVAREAGTCHAFARPAVKTLTFVVALISHSLPRICVCSTSVNVESKTLTLLAPCAGPLPGRFLVLGDIKWVE